VDNQSGVTPPQQDIIEAGECAEGVMKAYYPQAVYCDKDVLLNQGWQACFVQ
jgi:hypothetical protein